MTACTGSQSLSGIESQSLKLSPSLQFGYTVRENDCLKMTEIVAAILEQETGSTVELIEYETTDTLFATLAQQNAPIDLTLCFFDPIDRPYLSQYQSYISQIGGPIKREAEHKVLVMARPGFRSSLKQHNPCTYQFLQKLDFEDRQVTEQSAVEWIEENADIIQHWVECIESSTD